MRRSVFALAGALVAVLACSRSSVAHVRVFVDDTNTQIAACVYGKFVVRVPTEKPLPTVRLVLSIPNTVTVVATQSKPGWTASFGMTKGRVTSIEWSGGQIPPREFDEFAFLATSPKTPGTIDWNAAQYYADGSVVKWDGPPGADTPHSQTTVTPAACKRK